MSYKDITGEKFNRLTVLKRAGSDKHKNAIWECVCECDQCGEEERIPFEDGCIDYKEAQAELNSFGWVARKVDDEWHDFCSKECYYHFIKENK